MRLIQCGSSLNQIFHIGILTHLQLPPPSCSLINASTEGNLIRGEENLLIVSLMHFYLLLSLLSIPALKSWLVVPGNFSFKNLNDELTFPMGKVLLPWREGEREQERVSLETFYKVFYFLF